jgi:chemotaxis signal transduction protein
VSDALLPSEELVQFRAGAWRMLLPMRFVERVLGAALPTVSPAPAGEVPPVIAIGRTLVPVLFAEALLGAQEVRLGAEDQMILLRHGERRALLWVGAVEEVVEFAPVPPPSGAERGLVAAFSGADRPLAVLDVPHLLKVAA